MSTDIQKFLNIVTEGAMKDVQLDISSQINQAVDDVNDDKITVEELEKMINRFASSLSSDHGISFEAAKNLIDQHVDEQIAATGQIKETSLNPFDKVGKELGGWIYNKTHGVKPEPTPKNTTPEPTPPKSIPVYGPGTTQDMLDQLAKEDVELTEGKMSEVQAELDNILKKLVNRFKRGSYTKPQFDSMTIRIVKDIAKTFNVSTKTARQLIDQYVAKQLNLSESEQLNEFFPALGFLGVGSIEGLLAGTAARTAGSAVIRSAATNAAEVAAANAVRSAASRGIAANVARGLALDAATDAAVSVLSSSENTPQSTSSSASTPATSKTYMSPSVSTSSSTSTPSSTKTSDDEPMEPANVSSTTTVKKFVKKPLKKKVLSKVKPKSASTSSSTASSAKPVNEWGAAHPRRNKNGSDASKQLDLPFTGNENKKVVYYVYDEKDNKIVVDFLTNVNDARDARDKAQRNGDYLSIRTRFVPVGQVPESVKTGEQKKWLVHIDLASGEQKKIITSATNSDEAESKTIKWLRSNDPVAIVFAMAKPYQPVNEGETMHQALMGTFFKGGEKYYLWQTGNYRYQLTTSQNSEGSFDTVKTFNNDLDSIRIELELMGFAPKSMRTEGNFKNVNITRSGSNKIRDKADYLDKRQHLQQLLNSNLPKSDLAAVKQRLMDLEYAWGLVNKDTVNEAKFGLNKKVKVVSKGINFGKVGHIGEIKHGLHNKSPKHYVIDFDSGGNGMHTSDQLRLVADNTGNGSLIESVSSMDLGDILFGRLEQRYPNAVSTYGFGVVGDAVANVAEFHAGAEELGTSDISNMVREIVAILERSAKPNNDLNETSEGDGGIRLNKDNTVYANSDRARSFAALYVKAMRGDYRRGGGTALDNRNAERFWAAWEVKDTKYGYAGSGETVYANVNTGEQFKVVRQSSGDGFYGMHHNVFEVGNNVNENQSESANQYKVYIDSKMIKMFPKQDDAIDFAKRHLETGNQIIVTTSTNRVIYKFTHSPDLTESSLQKIKTIMSKSGKELGFIFRNEDESYGFYHKSGSSVEGFTSPSEANREFAEFHKSLRLPELNEVTDNDGEYTYQTEVDRGFEPGDTTKIFHYAVKSGRKPIDIDFTPYDYMSKKTFAKWIKLGMPSRQTSGPLDQQQIDTMYAQKFGESFSEVVGDYIKGAYDKVKTAVTTNPWEQIYKDANSPGMKAWELQQRLETGTATPDEQATAYDKQRVEFHRSIDRENKAYQDAMTARIEKERQSDPPSAVPAKVPNRTR